MASLQTASSVFFNNLLRSGIYLPANQFARMIKDSREMVAEFLKNPPPIHLPGRMCPCSTAKKSSARVN